MEKVIKKNFLFLILLFLWGNIHCASYSQQDPWCRKRDGEKNPKNLSLSPEERKKALWKFASKGKEIETERDSKSYEKKQMKLYGKSKESLQKSYGKTYGESPRRPAVRRPTKSALPLKNLAN